MPTFKGLPTFKPSSYELVLTDCQLTIRYDSRQLIAAACLLPWCDERRFAEAMENYEKGVVMGRGTFGSVYKAVQKEVLCYQADLTVDDADALLQPAAWCELVQTVALCLQTGKVVAIKKIDVGNLREVRAA